MFIMKDKVEWKNKDKSPVTQPQDDNAFLFINVCKHMSMARVRDNNRRYQLMDAMKCNATCVKQ